MEKSTGYSTLLRNLRFSTSPQVVREAFEKFGKIRDVYLPLDFNTRRPRGFGFVEFYDKADALDAVRAMDNTELDGSVITCCIAQDRRKSPSSMRRFQRNRSRRDYRSRSRSYRGRSRSPARFRDDRRRGYSRDRSPRRHYDRRDNRGYRDRYDSDHPKDGRRFRDRDFHDRDRDRNYRSYRDNGRTDREDFRDDREDFRDGRDDFREEKPRYDDRQFDVDMDKDKLDNHNDDYRDYSPSRSRSNP
ncbi:RNA recognition motif family protein [Theileria parva strain Muguga]|uniref:RRM domain-containing protein n=1 Tax=Theileria parva TaxID=5875 RepID=Q4N2F6_THEPA|nr:RNA recognition motif family protein [Theileria parva strain Muguga]EAN31745.1 RNA recognition motif family protein [Theileria parva strain Muguga]|eukprot:XP_764028.1 hypothetical protein [Theileria parva strain Muguga]